MSGTKLEGYIAGFSARVKDGVTEARLVLLLDISASESAQLVGMMRSRVNVTIESMQPPLFAAANPLTGELPS